MRRLPVFLMALFALGGGVSILGGLITPQTNFGAEDGLFEIGEGFLVSAFLFLAIKVVPDKPKIGNLVLSLLGGASAFMACFVLLVLHMDWYCHALYWGGSWACANLLNYSKLNWFIMPLRSILPVPLTAEVSFALAIVFLCLRFGARSTMKWFVILLLLVYTFVLSFYDPVEMPIQLTSFLAVSYHGIPLLSNRFFLLVSGATTELALIEDWMETSGVPQEGGSRGAS